MSLYSQNRVHAFSEEAWLEADKIVKDSEAKPEVSEEIEKKPEITNDTVDVKESTCPDVYHDPEMICEMFDDYIDENYNDDLEISLYIAEMQSKMDKTLDAVFENFEFVNEADNEDGSDNKEETQSEDQQQSTDSQPKLSGPTASKTQLKVANAKEVIGKIIAKLKEIIGKIAGKLKDFVQRFSEDFMAFFEVDKRIFNKYFKYIKNANSDDFKDFPGVTVNKELFLSVIQSKAFNLVGGYDFTSFISPLRNNKIEVNMDKAAVNQASEKFKSELDGAKNKLDETIKGFNAKPEKINPSLDQVKTTMLVLFDSIKNNNAKYIGIEKEYKELGNNTLDILENMNKMAKEALEKVQTENQDKDSDIIYAAKALYKNTTDATLACANAIVNIGKYNLKKLSTTRKVFVAAGKYLSGDKEETKEDNTENNEEQTNTSESVELVTESPLAAGIATMSAVYIAYIAGVMKLASVVGLKRINKALKKYESNHKADADFVKFSDMKKETMRKSGTDNEKDEKASSKIAKLFGKGTYNDTVDIYKDKDGNEIFRVSYKKKLTSDSRNKIQFTMLDKSKEKFADYYIAGLVTKKFGFTSAKVEAWANDVLLRSNDSSKVDLIKEETE